jgi:hypothetical protein
LQTREDSRRRLWDSRSSGEMGHGSTIPREIRSASSISAACVAERHHAAERDDRHVVARAHEVRLPEWHLAGLLLTSPPCRRAPCARRRSRVPVGLHQRPLRVVRRRRETILSPEMRVSSTVTSTSGQRAGSATSSRACRPGRLPTQSSRCTRSRSPTSQAGTGGSMPRAGGQPTAMQPGCNPAGPTVAAPAEGGDHGNRRGDTTATGRLRAARRPLRHRPACRRDRR